jgi:hypothetical protein
MKKMILRMSRRERLYMIAGTAVLLFGVVVYPATKKAAAFQQEQMELLEEELVLRADYEGMIANEFAIEVEHELLRDALGETDGLLFPPIDNPIMLQSRMTQLLNEMGPDLELEISAGRSSVGNAATQVNLSIRGQGRYSAILKFLQKIETHRPVIVVDSLVTSTSSKGRGPSSGGPPGRGGPSSSGYSRDPRDYGRGPSSGGFSRDSSGRPIFGSRPQTPATSQEPSKEPSLQLRLSVHINCEEAGGEK